MVIIGILNYLNLEVDKDGHDKVYYDEYFIVINSKMK